MNNHPAFVANIAGTLIEHPEHAPSRYFAACQLCRSAKGIAALPMSPVKNDGAKGGS